MSALAVPLVVPKVFDHDRYLVKEQAAAPPKANQVTRVQTVSGLEVEAYPADYLKRDDDDHVFHRSSGYGAISRAASWRH